MSVRVALVGHVDHGKSTLIGRLLSDTGQSLPERSDRVRNFCESTGRKFEYAFLLDALEEEQSQGITIDVTEVNWKYGGRSYTFVDTPGHREFLKKMVGGASNVDAAILILDAAEGVKESFQRQMMVLDLLGVRQRIVVINKMDLVNWREDTFIKRREEIFRAVGGDNTLIKVIPVAAWHGVNLLKRGEEMTWYKGPSLADGMEQLNATQSASEGPLRFSVQDVYKSGEKRIYVGRVESGALSAGEELEFFPGNTRSRVVSIELFEENRERALAGDAIGITLEKPLFLDRGSLGFLPSRPINQAKEITADIFWLDKEPLRVGDRLKIKAGTQSAAAAVDRVLIEIDGETFHSKESAMSIALFGRIRLKFSEPFAFDAFSDCEATGRFVALKDGKVLGGGRWLREEKLLFREESSVTKREREERFGHRGMVLWFTGLSGAGKSTIAKALERRLFDSGINAFILDGDNVRRGLSKDLDFSEEGRNENLRRVAEAAALMADAGLVVLTAFISPLATNRDAARQIIGHERFLEVFVDCPLGVCERRDVKGLYGKARRGELTEFTGISAPFEAPVSADAHLRTDILDLEAATQALAALVLAKAKC